MDISAIIGELRGLDRLTETKTINQGDGGSHEQTYHHAHHYGPAFFPSEREYNEYCELVDRLALYESNVPTVLAELSRLRAELEHERQRAEGAEKGSAQWKRHVAALWQALHAYEEDDSEAGRFILSNMQKAEGSPVTPSTST